MRSLRHLCTLLIACSLGTLLMAQASRPATAPASAPAVIDALAGDILAVLRDPSIEKEARRQKVRDLASQKIDFDTLSRLTLGQHWRTLTEDQRTLFVREFKLHLAATYGNTTDKYTDEEIKPNGDRQESNGDWTVQTRILGTREGARKEVAKVDYRLRKTGPDWKIIDVTIDGVSLMANFRSQFQDIMANGGFNALIKALRDKNAAADK
jgi:phospholipid transport system substrate-binding protein